MDKVALHGDTLVKQDPRVMLDFSSIAKGMACDEIGRMLTRNGARNWLVEIGGEVMASGINQRGTAWQVSVDMPTEEQDSVTHESAMTLALDSGAVATSGNYRKWRVEGNKKLSHIIDPHTGDSRTGTLLSVTVTAPDCMTADAWATACMAMGDSATRALMQGRNDLGVMTITADTVSGALVVWSNAKFASKINSK
jgi:thiamine biosynthesis lipoprotein